MKKIIMLLVISLVGGTVQAQSKKNQTAPTAQPVLKIPMEASRWEYQAGKVEFLEHRSVPAMKLVGRTDLAVLKALDFTDGTIEFDMETLDPYFASFYFRWQSPQENECFYFRTGRAGDPTAGDAVQYAPFLAGVNLWDMLGHYQTNATIKKDAWNHVKLVISGKQLRVYVNETERPTLQVDYLEGNTRRGTLAFEGQIIVANVVVKPNQTEGLSPEPGIDPTDYEPRYLRRWQVTSPTTLPAGVDFSTDYLPKAETTWESLAAERRGLVNLTRPFGKSESRRLVWLRVKLHADTAQRRRLGGCGG